MEITSHFPSGRRSVGVKEAGLLIAATFLALAGCDKTGGGISLTPSSQSFLQNAGSQPKPIDVLWVVDNSNSMMNSQTNMVNNFSSFINRFQTLGYDFHMGVTGSDAYLSQYYPSQAAQYARLRDGDGSTHSGTFVMLPETLNLASVFSTNAMLGVYGSGDERPFQSFETALSYTGNSDFRRSNATLAIIILSDEDDFSRSLGEYIYSAGSGDHNYSEPTMIPVSHYVNFLDGYAGAGNWSVSTISIKDSACLAQLAVSSQIIGQRYLQLSAASTNGVQASICANFADSLNLISQSIVQLSSQFHLDREPDPSTLLIRVNGAMVNPSSTNGWVYDQAHLTITFNGTAVPAAGSTITADFTPLHPIM